MKLSDSKYWLPVFLALAISCSISLRYMAPIGYDFSFHLEIARVWSRGELGMLSDLPMRVNKMPYPPLFHLILVPSVWLNIEIEFAAVLQAFFYPLAVASMMWLWWKKDKMSSLVAGLLVMGSYAFFDRSIQVIPQALDMILLPLIIYYSLHGNRRFIPLSALLIYNHGLVSLALLGGLYVWEWRKQRIKNVAYSLLQALPIIAISAYYFLDAFSRFTGSYETLQELQFWTNPLFSLSYLRLLFLGIPLAIYLLIAELPHRLKDLSDLEKISLLTLGSMLVLVPSWADRFLQFSTIPLTILLVETISRAKQPKRDLWLYGVLFSFIIFYATLWIWLFADIYFVGV